MYIIPQFESATTIICHQFKFRIVSFILISMF